MTEKLYKAKVSYYETDCMNIVHHSNFIRYFEDARIQYMHDIGCDVAEMQLKMLGERSS
jgi:acyl-CoA thioester hydrolase